VNAWLDYRTHRRHGSRKVYKGTVVMVSGFRNSQYRRITTVVEMREMKKNQKFSFLTAIIVILELFAFSYDFASAQQRRKILVAYVAPGLTQAIPWITKEAGIFAKRAIDADVVLLTGSPRIIKTLIAGVLDYEVVGNS